MKSESFTIEISMPAVDSGEKIIKKISKILPAGTALKLVPTDVKYSDVKNQFGEARPKEENTITINR